MAGFDYVIVGSGSAGSVLAGRLGEDSGVSILVIEAGGADRDPFISIPIGIGIMHQRRSHDWGYDTEPEPGLGGRSIEAMRGKVVGGSSTINHMSWVRGNRGDYDRWAGRGLAGWSYAEVLPYFRRAETWEEGASTYRGGDGPLHIRRGRTNDSLFDAFIEASRALGHPFNADHNGAAQEGIARAQNNILGGRRHSLADAYLRPALARGNVTLETGAQATRIIMEGTRATGIEYVKGGRTVEAHAARQVMLSGGVFNSPQLLMLSGIGPADALKAQGIAPLIDLPGVGRNLQDHIAVIVNGTRPVPGPFVGELRADRMTLSIIRAALFGSGPATVLPGGMHGYIKTEPGLSVPDIQLMFRGVSTAPHLWFPGIRKPQADSCGVRPVLLHPQSRGWLTLASSDPFDKVRIQQNFFAEPSDMETLRKGFHVCREILAHPAMDAYRGRELAPGAEVTGAAEIDAWMRATAITAHHPCATCAMGVGGDAVLDGEFKVRGAENLRVVDASAMPDLVSGNINACVVMMAEKASDQIRGRVPLPAAEV
ncbi:MAG: GMC family oxidoreductase N-terminal domain-containing protein [Alphaproteobacteria bacterium]|nr:GMC family oxidoreductase N-terminal domain-containing protein [Alphaproteobacteria bacterium]